jgi:hypothetical protein
MLESDDIRNDRNAPKKVFRITLLGFCGFVTQSELFKSVDPNDVEFSTQKQFLKTWKHLHESIESYYILFLKTMNKEKDLMRTDKDFYSGFTRFFLLCLHHVCEKIFGHVLERVDSDREVLRKTPIRDVFDNIIRGVFDNIDIDTRFYHEMFEELTHYFSIPMVSDEWGPLSDEIILFFKEPEGKLIIKNYLKGEFHRYEKLKKIDKLL